MKRVLATVWISVLFYILLVAKSSGQTPALLAGDCKTEFQVNETFANKTGCCLAMNGGKPACMYYTCGNATVFNSSCVDFGTDVSTLTCPVEGDTPNVTCNEPKPVNCSMYKDNQVECCNAKNVGDDKPACLFYSCGAADKLTTACVPANTTVSEVKCDSGTDQPDIKCNAPEVNCTALNETTCCGATKSDNTTACSLYMCGDSDAKTPYCFEKGANFSCPGEKSTPADACTPTTTTTTTTTSATPTTTPQATTKPTTPNATSTMKPTATPAPSTGGDSGQHFDAASFIGGIVLCAGLMAIGYFGLKFYRARQDRNYHTL